MAKKKAAEEPNEEVTGEKVNEERAGLDADYKIENVVATVAMDITGKIDLNVLAQKYPDVEYNPERFPSLIMRVVDPKATILVFSTGMYFAI